MCALTFAILLSLSFTGSSRQVPQKRSTTQGSSDDENAGFPRPVRKAQAKQPAGRKKAQVEKKKQKGPSKKGKETRVNYKTGLSTTDYLLIRQKDWYEKPRDAELVDRRFWCLEQSHILTDIYSSYKYPIRPMNPTKLQYLKDKSAFAQAARVIERFQLDTLLEFRCPYNVDLVVQFMSTLVVANDPYKTLKWMSGSSYCHAPFSKLIEGIGYQFQDHPPIGHRMHDERPSREKLMADMYAPGGTIGKVEGLLPFYGQLVRLFRSFIFPSGGNNDALTSPLVHLLVLAKQCIEDEDENKACPVDVGDVIFHELYNAMVGGHTIPYAPFIMQLIKNQWKSGDFSGMPMVDHHFKKLYMQREKTLPTPAPDSGFMRDVRASGTIPRAPPSDNSFVPQIRKLSWFQRNILCMKVDIHREQYMTYKREVALADAQKQILHHVSNAPRSPPAATPIDSYARFCEGDYTPWTQIAAALDDTSAKDFTYAQHDPLEDEDEDAEEDVPEAEGESETSAGESSEDDDE